MGTGHKRPEGYKLFRAPNDKQGLSEGTWYVARVAFLLVHI